MKSRTVSVHQIAGTRFRVKCDVTRPATIWRKRGIVAAADAETSSASYVAPSFRGGSTELQALERLSEIVPDVILSQRVSEREPAKAATASRAVLAGLMASPATTGPYKFGIEQARYFKPSSPCSKEDLTAMRVDRALANVAAIMKDNVTGRVSVEVDPRLANDSDALTHRGQQLAELCVEAGAPKDRIVLRIPATWEGIQAAAALEAQNIATHLISTFSFVQTAAAAQVGTSVVQINVGRISDWYDRNPGVLRDPHGPREGRAMMMAGYGTASPNPGVLLVEKAWSYCKNHHSKTKIMASGLRSKEEALALAGCDFLVMGPRVLESLGSASTLSGYNDGLHAAQDGDIKARLTEEFASSYDFDPVELKAVDEAAFKDQLGMVGSELLEADIKRLVADADRLEPIFLNQVGGQE